MLTKQEFFPLFWVDNENSLDDFRTTLLCGKCAQLLGKAIRLSFHNAYGYLVLMRADPSMLSSFVLSSGKRLVFALPPPSSLLFLQQDKKGEKEDHFPFQSTFCHTENKLMPR